MSTENTGSLTTESPTPELKQTGIIAFFCQQLCCRQLNDDVHYHYGNF